MVKKLTAKQAAFVDEYLIDLNATQAAIRAGYSKKTAGAIGEENLKKPEIANALQAAMAERSKRTKIDADWLLSRLADEVEADVADLYDDTGNILPVPQWPKIWRQGLVAGIDVVAEENVGVVTKIKLSDRVRRLEMIGKHVGVLAFKERVEVSADESVAALLSAARQRVTDHS